MKVLKTYLPCHRICPNWKKQNFQFFYGISCPLVRALVAVALGCDVNLHAATTPAKMMSFIVSKDISNILSADACILIKNYVVSCWLSSQKRKNIISNKTTQTNINIVSEVDIEQDQYNKMIDVFVDSFLFEP
jgi:hypothetical protein